MELKDKLEQLADTLTSAEKACLKLILANAVAESIDDADLSADTIKAKAFRTSVVSISRLQSHKDLIPENGIVFRGYPEFLTNETLTNLQKESKDVRSQAIRFHDHFVVSNAPVAKSFASSPELNNLLSERIGATEPTGKANYIYYDEIGMGIEPHIDNEDFSLNVIMMLNHEWSDQKSALVLFPYDKPPVKMFLQPGELIAFFADSVIHSRERISKGEKVSIVAFGFRPV